MNNKTCIVTGGSSGIGFETAKALTAQGARVIIIGRNPEKVHASVESIRKSTSSGNITFVLADLSKQNQIREAAAEILKNHQKIDVLVNNAGTWFSKMMLTQDGIETQFAVNHLAYFLLTQLLLPALVKSKHGRIINISSDSHFHGKIHFDDLNLTKNYHGLRAYAQSKLANVLFTYELDRGLKKRNLPITVNAVQPGLVKTDIGVKHTISFHSLAWRIRRMSGVSPAEGAQTSIYLASSSEVEGISGKYWDKCKSKPSSKASYDLDDARKLWGICVELCHVEDYFSGLT